MKTIITNTQALRIELVKKKLDMINKRKSLKLRRSCEAANEKVDDYSLESELESLLKENAA